MNKENKRTNSCKDKGQHNLRNLIEGIPLLKCVKCKKIFTIFKEKDRITQTGKIRIEEVKIK